MGGKVRGKGLSSKASVGDAPDSEIDALTRLLTIESKIESLESCLNYVQNEIKILKAKRSNVKLELEEIRAQNHH